MKKIEKRMMTTAMAELIFTNSDYLESGVPPGKLIKAMSTRENAAYSRKNLEAIIQRELETGSLVKMDNGNYTLGAGGENDDSNDMDSFNADSNPKMTSSNNSSSASSPLRMKGKPGRKKGSTGSKIVTSAFMRSDIAKLTGVRVGERHKRAKKVFDPSDNNAPVKKKRGRPLGTFKTSKKTLHDPMHKNKVNMESGGESDICSDEEKDLIVINREKMESRSLVVTGGVCSVCRQHKNTKDNSGKLVSCRDCSNKAHIACLRGGDGMLRLRPDNTWQCPHCKTCVVCIETNDAGLLTVCSVCADAYHTLCHSPPIPEKLKAWDQWECRNCLETKNTHALDTTYIEKIPSGSEHSSKNSDRSDSRKSSSERKRDKSVKSVDSDDKNNDKDEGHSPLSEHSEWKTNSRKVISPNRKSSFDWKQNGRKSSEGDDKKTNHTKPLKPKSIYMDNFENNKWKTVSTYQKHPNDHVTTASEEDVDQSIPSIEKWSNSDVYKYFVSHFPEEAQVFKEQEIDGKSLLLMRRNDLIHSFNLPLGPALKMYRHVVKLQTRKDDFSMCWV